MCNPRCRCHAEAAANAKAFQGLIDAATRAGAVAFNQWRTAEVTEKVVQYQYDLANFRDSYMEANKGKDAVEAGRTYSEYAKQRADQLLGEIEGADPTLRQMFFKNTAPTDVSFMEQGQAYARQERESYVKTQQAGLVTTFDQFVAANYKDEKALKEQLKLTKEQIAALNPGMDMTAVQGKLDASLVSNRIGSFLADGNLCAV